MTRVFLTDFSHGTHVKTDILKKKIESIMHLHKPKLIFIKHIMQAMYEQRIGVPYIVGNTMDHQ
jgi:hypothetical protein